MALHLHVLLEILSTIIAFHLVRWRGREHRYHSDGNSALIPVIFLNACRSLLRAVLSPCHSAYVSACDLRYFLGICVLRNSCKGFRSLSICRNYLVIKLVESSHLGYFLAWQGKIAVLFLLSGQIVWNWFWVAPHRIRTWLMGAKEVSRLVLSGLKASLEVACVEAGLTEVVWMSFLH